MDKGGNENRLVIESGNTLDMSFLKRRALTGAEELYQALTFVLRCKSVASLDGIKRITCQQKEDQKNPQDRSALRITLKLFPFKLRRGFISEALENVLQILQIEYVESLVLTLPMDRDYEATFENIKLFWEEMQLLNKSGKTITLGISDLTHELLQELYDWAEVKPRTLQINLANCCVVPPEIREFAEENHIQILTHTDEQ
ncbi:unnamed protein product, partial [Darwinula stevensoni]